MNAPAPAPSVSSPLSRRLPATDEVSGDWKGTAGPVTFTMRLTLGANNMVSGTIASSEGSGTVNGAYNPATHELTLSITLPGGQMGTITGKISGTTFTGTVSGGGHEFACAGRADVTARRARSWRTCRSGSLKPEPSLRPPSMSALIWKASRRGPFSSPYAADVSAAWPSTTATSCSLRGRARRVPRRARASNCSTSWTKSGRNRPWRQARPISTSRPMAKRY